MNWEIHKKSFLLSRLGTEISAVPSLFMVPGEELLTLRYSVSGREHAVVLRSLGAVYEIIEGGEMMRLVAIGVTNLERHFKNRG